MLLNLKIFEKIITQKRYLSYTVKELRLKEHGKWDTSLELHTKTLNDSELKLKNNQVFVKLVATPINPTDINLIAGRHTFLGPRLSTIIGIEGLFEVVMTSNKCKRLKVGDWVLPTDFSWGSWRSHAIAKEGDFLKIPNNLNKHLCANLLVNPSTAYKLLNDIVELKPNDTLIQNGANSVVGQIIIQLASKMNVNLINIVRKRENQAELNDYLSSLGAKYIFTEEDLCSSIELKEGLWKKIAKPKLALNCVGGKAAYDMVRLVDDDATLVTYGNMSGQALNFNASDFVYKNLRAIGFWITSWRPKNQDSFNKNVQLLCDLIGKGQIKPPKCEEFKIEDYKEAFKRNDVPFNNKKILLVE